MAGVLLIPPVFNRVDVAGRVVLPFLNRRMFFAGNDRDDAQAVAGVIEGLSGYVRHCDPDQTVFCVLY